MIKCEQIIKKCSCDNCNRGVNFTVKYTFTQKDEKYNELTLCEDCSNALSNLHYKVMEQGKSHKYDLDEIVCE